MKSAKDLEIPVQIGNTIGCDDFYESQCRLDGALCDYTEQDKFDFIRKAYNNVSYLYIHKLRIKNDSLNTYAQFWPKVYSKVNSARGSQYGNGSQRFPLILQPVKNSRCRSLLLDCQPVKRRPNYIDKRILKGY